MLSETLHISGTGGWASIVLSCLVGTATCLMGQVCFATGRGERVMGRHSGDRGVCVPQGGGSVQFRRKRGGDSKAGLCSILSPILLVLHRATWFNAS